jgi:hypothetical protein
MKRFDLVQVAIVIAGIYSAFCCLALIPTFLYYSLSWFSDGLRGGYMMRSFVQNILLLTVYLLFAILSIRNSRRLAEWVSDKASLDGDVNFSLDVRQLLFALFVAFGVYGLMWNLPQLGLDIYDFFKRDRTLPFEDTLSTINKDHLFNQVAKTALFFIVLVYANVFSQFFADKIRKSAPSEETEDKLI